MSRLAGFEPAKLNLEQRRFYDTIVGGPRASAPRPIPIVNEYGQLQGPFNAMLLDPSIGMALQTLGRVVRFEGCLPDRTRELVVLTIATVTRSEYEWRVHETVARELGLGDLEFDAVRDPGSRAVLPELERLAVELAEELTRDGTLCEVSYQTGCVALGERGIFELTVVCGYYRLLSTLLHTFGADRPGDPPTKGNPT